MQRMLIILSIMLMCVASAPSAAAQSSGVTVNIELTDGDTGAALTDSCFMLVDASTEGCDDDGDGLVRFEDVGNGRYTVSQTVESAGYLPIGDFSVFFGPEQSEWTIPVETFSYRTQETSADIDLELVDATTGETVTGTDPCFIFEGGSESGCDENGDGIITFDDMAVGSYLLVNRGSAQEYLPVTQQWIGIHGNDTITVETEPAYPDEDVSGTPDSTPPADDFAADIALVTRDPDTSELVTGTCYVLAGFSNEGCDEDGDGRVTFDDVPAGVYDVEQTATPPSAVSPDPFAIEVDADFPVQQFLVKQAEAQNETGTRNLSVGFYDTDAGEMVSGPDICVTVEGDIASTYDINAREFVSSEGCDDNDDGFIDFFDVPVGDHRIAISGENLPGYTFVNDLGYAIEETDINSDVWIVNVTAE